MAPKRHLKVYICVIITLSNSLYIAGAEFMGEIFANFFGLTQSKYQWVIDMKEAEEEKERHKALCDRQRRELRLKKLIEQERKRQSELEIGDSNEKI